MIQKLTLETPSKKKSTEALNKKDEFDDLCDNFINKVNAKKTAVEAFHPKISTAKGVSGGGKITSNLRFVWTIYSTLIEGVVSDWEVFFKMVTMVVAEQRFEMYKKTKDAKVFGQSLKDKFQNALKGLDGLEIVANDRDIFLELAENIVFGKQNISWCTPDELAYVKLPLEDYNKANLGNTFFPACYLELMERSFAVKRASSIPTEFIEAVWVKTKERWAFDSSAARVFAGLGVSTEIIRDIFPDPLRYMMEACAQIRHAKIHEGFEPNDEDQMKMGLFTVDVFTKAGLCLKDNLKILFDDDSYTDRKEK